MKEVVDALKVITDFLNTLTDENIKDLITGKVILKIEYKNEKKKTTNEKKKHTDKNIVDICYNIECFKTREEAINYLKSANLTNNELRVIAQKYDIPITSKDKKSVMIEKIVEDIVGSKLRFDTLLEI